MRNEKLKELNGKQLPFFCLLFVFSSLMPLIVKDFNLPFSLSTTPIAFGKLSYVLLLLPGGHLVDSPFGPRRSILLGLICLSFLTFLYSLFPTTYTHILILHFLLAAAAAISGVPVYSVIIAQWFNDGLGVAMGLVLAGYSFGGMIYPLILGPIAKHFGWKIAMGIVSVVLGAVAVPIAWLFLKENKMKQEYQEILVIDDDDHFDVDHMIDSDDDEFGYKEGVDFVGESTKPLLKPASSKFSLKISSSTTTITARRDEQVFSQVLVFCGFACSYILLQYCFGTYAENLLFYLTADCQMDISIATLFLSSLNMAAFVAKLLGGHLGDKYNRMNVASMSCILTSIGILFLFSPSNHFDLFHLPKLTKSELCIFLFTIVFGLGYGATFNALYALVPIVFGQSHLGRIQSALFGLGLIGNAVGSVLTGVFRSHYGSYDRAFLIGLLCCITNATIFNFTRHALSDQANNFMTTEEEEEEGEETSCFHQQGHTQEKHSGTFDDTFVQSGYAAPSTKRTRTPSSSSSLSFPTPPPTPSPPLPYQHQSSQQSTLNHPNLSSISLPLTASDFNLLPTLADSLQLQKSASSYSHVYTPPAPSNSNIPQYDCHHLSNQQQLLLKRKRRKRRLARNHTFENLVRNGVLSASMEFVSYFGRTSSWEM